MAANVENLTLGGAFNINGTGNALHNVIFGSAGANKIDGAGGNDFIFGDNGDDTLVGGAGNDEINGGAGTDHLSGGAGNDNYTVDDQFDTVVEKAGGGTDQVITSVDNMVLADNVEICSCRRVPTCPRGAISSRTSCSATAAGTS